MHPPTTSNAQGRPLTERSKNYRPTRLRIHSTQNMAEDGKRSLVHQQTLGTRIIAANKKT